MNDNKGLSDMINKLCKHSLDIAAYYTDFYELYNNPEYEPNWPWWVRLYVNITHRLRVLF